MISSVIRRRNEPVEGSIRAGRPFHVDQLAQQRPVARDFIVHAPEDFVGVRERGTRPGQEFRFLADEEKLRPARSGQDLVRLTCNATLLGEAGGTHCDYIDESKGRGASLERLIARLGQDDLETLERMDRIEEDIEDIRDDIDALKSHTHDYLTGRGVGHNNTDAQTSPPGFDDSGTTNDAAGSATTPAQSQTAGANGEAAGAGSDQAPAARSASWSCCLPAGWPAGSGRPKTSPAPAGSRVLRIPVESAPASAVGATGVLFRVKSGLHSSITR